MAMSTKIVRCSACGLQGHNKRNKICPAIKTPNNTLNTFKPYIKPVILYSHVNSEYYSIFDVNIPYEMIHLMIEQNIIRWAFYSYKTKLYCVCDRDIFPNNIDDGIIKIAFIIPKPTVAIIHLKAWELIYTPPVVDNSIQIDCSICYESLPSNKFITMNCNHSFCLSCIQGCIHSIKVSEQQVTCPLCRTVVTQVNVPDIPIYNSLAETLYKL